MAKEPTAEVPELYRIDRGAGELALFFPRNETLVYEVHLDLGWLGNPAVGQVTMTSEVSPFLSAIEGQAPGEQVLLKGHAEGSYQVYTLDNVISSSILIRRSMYQSTIFGTSVRPRAPPNAVPFQTRPVTS